jgi:hypothetical protein
MNEHLTVAADYHQLLERISSTYEQARQDTFRAVNRHMVEAYWTVGRNIVEYEQGEKAKADYGKALKDTLARDLTLRHGKGFSRSNLIRFRRLYLAYPKSATLSHQLSWSLYVELLKIEDPLERAFYEAQSLRENWNVRELIRQKQSALFLRLAAGKRPEEIVKLASKGHVVEQPSDILHEPYIFEFLKISESYCECDHFAPYRKMSLKNVLRSDCGVLR